MAHIVSGEAPESDDDTPKHFGLSQKVKLPIYASEVTGEASESDEDVYEMEAGDDNMNKATVQKPNILQSKLIETNVNLWKGYNNFMKNAIIAASQQLITTDQKLLKSQVSIQSALMSLKTGQGNMRHFYERFNDILTLNFIPNIQVCPRQDLSDTENTNKL